MDLHEEIGRLTATLLHRDCAANADRGGGAIGLVR